MNAAPRPLARSLDDRMIAGVMGGIARRFGWNATWVRIGTALFGARDYGQPTH